MIPSYWFGRQSLNLPSSKKWLILPNSLLSIGMQAFFDAYWDNKLVLSNKLQTIPQNAFSFYSLPELIIPNSVKKIEANAFNTRISQHVATGITHEYWIWPKDLKSLTLGTGIETIEKDAFGESLNLESFYCLASNPPEFVFEKFNSNATVLVPPGKLNIYKSAPGWDHFKTFKELPNVLIQFALKEYFINSNESAELRYEVSNLANVDIVSTEWVSTPLVVW